MLGGFDELSRGSSCFTGFPGLGRQTLPGVREAAALAGVCSGG